MRGRMPKDVRFRPKKALRAPDAAWWRTTRLPDWAEDCLTENAIRDTGYFDPGEVNAIRAAHQSRKHDMSSLLAGVLGTQLWHREVLNA